MSGGKTSILPVNVERRRSTAVARKQSGTKDDVKFLAL